MSSRYNKKHLTSVVTMKKYSSLCAVLILLITSLSFAGTSMPSTFTYQGRLMNSAGNAALAGPLTLYVEVRSPSGACLLYSEHQAIDTTTSGGLFSIQIGAGTRTSGVAGYTNDPGYQFSEIF